MFKIKGNIVNIESKQVYYGEILVVNGLVDKIDFLGEEKLGEVYVLPGFVDSHIHIESSMLVPSEFANVAVRTGVVATVSDPHEIANILGERGVDYMRENGQSVGFKFFFGVPSCVPAVPFDRSGAVLDSVKVDEMLRSGSYYFLSEMMNFPGVVNKDAEVMAKINSALSLGYRVDGHAPGLKGCELMKYASAGVTTDHECMTMEEAEDKVKCGMKIQIREGSAAKNFDSLIGIAKKYPDEVMLCSDDCHPDDLLDGYFVGLVRRSIRAGVSVFDAIRIAGYNAVKHYNIPVGLLRKGDAADFIIVDNFQDFNVIQTFINGELVYNNGAVLLPSVNVDVLNNFVANYLTQEDVKVCSSGNEVDVKVIGVVDGELYTKSEITTLNIDNGVVNSDVDNDILKIVVLNRYQPAKPAVAFIKGFGLKKGAICSSVSHDSHNVVAVGADDASIVKVVNGVLDAKGGLAYADENTLSILELPVAGIMSNLSAEVVAKKYRDLLSVAESSGSNLKAPFMTLAFMSLVVIPELKLSDTGLFDVCQFKPTSLFVDGRK